LYRSNQIIGLCGQATNIHGSMAVNCPVLRGYTMRKYKMMADGRWWEKRAIRSFRKKGYKADILTRWKQCGGFAVAVVEYAVIV